MPSSGNTSLLHRKTSIRLVPALDRYEWSVKLVQRPVGKILILVTYASLLALVLPGKWLFLVLCLAAFSFFPGWRSPLLVLATLGSVALSFSDLDWSPVVYISKLDRIPAGLVTQWTMVLVLALVFLLFGLLTRLARGFKGFTLSRPVLTVLILYCSLLITVSYIPMAPTAHFTLWMFLILFGNYIWFLAYSLVEARAPDKKPFIRQLGHYRPFWYPSMLPIPKGASYLSSIEAKTPEEMAVTQLKGLKLLYWGVILWFFGLLIEGFLFGYAGEPSRVFEVQWQGGSLNFLRNGVPLVILVKRTFPYLIPPYQLAFDQCISGTPLPVAQSWMSLVAYFFIDILHLAAVTHVGISLCRMCGYRALRNVNNPLASKSISEFWNRYYYYFKELLVHIFFYPTFFRYFKKNPTLRLFFSTMTAVFIGNFTYHMFTNLSYVHNFGFFKAIWSYQTFLFYCFVLGLGIFVSQWRKTLLKGDRSILPGYLKPLPVLGFYCLLTIFADHRHESILQNFKFFLYLFGVNQ